MTYPCSVFNMRRVQELVLALGSRSKPFTLATLPCNKRAYGSSVVYKHLPNSIHTSFAHARHSILATTLSPLRVSDLDPTVPILLSYINSCKNPASCARECVTGSSRAFVILICNVGSLRQPSAIISCLSWNVFVSPMSLVVDSSGRTGP